MIVKHESEIKNEKVEDKDANNVYIKWLLGEESKAPNFYLRKLQVMPMGNTPHHTHPYEHVVYVLKGRGVLIKKEGHENIEPGTFALVPPNVIHQFKNPNPEVLEFLCLIPKTV